MALRQEELSKISADIRAKLMSGEEAFVKKAGLAASEYFRVELRENGIRRQITPPTNVTPDMLDPSEHSDFPSMIVEIAPQCFGAKHVSFETGPQGEVIHGRKSRVEFNRIMTDRYTIDKVRLHTYKMPLLDILYDLMLKNIMDVEDKVCIEVDDEICGVRDAGSEMDPDLRRYASIGALDDDTNGGRAALIRMKQGMKYAPGQLQPAKYVMNDITYDEFGIFDRTTIGGDMAQDIFINGVTLTKLMGVDTIITTKRDIVKNDDVYIYATPKYYGGFYTFEDVSMVTKEIDNIWLTFFAHETVGFSVVNVAGVCKAHLGGTFTGWRVQ
jgi:hypothetical protein